jgi:hypothetical protein
MSTTKLAPLLALGLLLFAGCQDQVPPLAPDDAALAVAENAGKGPQVQPPRVGDYTIEMFDVEFPGEVIRNTVATGINGQGEVVGNYQVWLDGQGAWRRRGFLYSDGRFHPIHVPGALNTLAYGINDRGDIAGTWGDGTTPRGFILRDGEYTTVEVPGGNLTYSWDINANGAVTGHWRDLSGRFRGYVMDGGVFTTFDVPGGVTRTYPKAINPQGDIVGWYFDPERDPTGPNRYWPFLRLADGTFITDHEYPEGPIWAMAHIGINPRGDIVGFFRPRISWSPYYGFVLDKQGIYTKLEIPDAWETIPYGINASGVLAGTVYYWDHQFNSKTPYNDNTVATRGWIGFPARGAGK